MTRSLSKNFEFVKFFYIIKNNDLLIDKSFNLRLRISLKLDAFCTGK